MVIPCYRALEGRSRGALERREQERWHHKVKKDHGLHYRLDDTLWGTLGPLMGSEQLTARQAFYMHILHASPQGITIMIKLYEVHQTILS